MKNQKNRAGTWVTKEPSRHMGHQKVFLSTEKERPREMLQEEERKPSGKQAGVVRSGYLPPPRPSVLLSSSLPFSKSLPAFSSFCRPQVGRSKRLRAGGCGVVGGFSQHQTTRKVGQRLLGGDVHVWMFECLDVCSFHCEDRMYATYKQTNK